MTEMSKVTIKDWIIETSNERVRNKQATTPISRCIQYILACSLL